MIFREIFIKTNATSEELFLDSSEILADTGKVDDGCQAADCILGGLIFREWRFSGSITELMYTSLVEYSLIGAAVMFTVWRNIGSVKMPSEYVRRKHHIRINCSKTTTGTFSCS